jgi:hypothetical protein
LFLILALGCIAYLASNLFPQREPPGRHSAQADLLAEELPAGRDPVPAREPIPVALNRGPTVLDGFRADVHPLLHGRTQLEVTAHWAPLVKGQAVYSRKGDHYPFFTELRPARPQQTYTERDFSALDTDKVAGFLRQFHPRPLMHLVAPGRRAGPDGAFALLRAVSPSYLDIVFRIHAEFYVTPEAWGSQPPMEAWYTPAYFSGRVLVNKGTGTVDHFRLALATDKALNVHLTIDSHIPGYIRQTHDIVRVERMELTGGDGGIVENIPWAKALTSAEAQARLAKVFYKSLEIDWVPVDEALARARNQGRPIFAIVSWGATDDQSC